MLTLEVIPDKGNVPEGPLEAENRGRTPKLTLDCAGRDRCIIGLVVKAFSWHTSRSSSSPSRRSSLWIQLMTVNCSAVCRIGIMWGLLKSSSVGLSLDDQGPHSHMPLK